MQATEARALLFNRKLQGKDVDISIPGVPELDGELFIAELSARDTRIIAKMSTKPDGKSDSIAAQAAMICRSLRMKNTKERVFQDLDIDAIAGNDKPDGGVGADQPVHGFGTFILKLLGDEIGKLSGFDDNAIEQAKADFLQIQLNGSSTHSTEISEEPVQG